MIKYLLMLFIFIILNCNLSDAHIVKTKGPYKTTAKVSKPCGRVNLPRPKPEYGPVDVIIVEVYKSGKTYLIRGNLTVRSTNKGVAVNASAYIWKNGKWTLHFSLPMLDCKNAVIVFITKVIGVNYDQQKCSFPKGVFKFTKLDLNIVDHMWAQEREYGRVLWRVEVFTKVYTLHCFLVETLVEPKSKK